MRIAVYSSFVPFVHGGLRNIVEWLEDALRESGHEAERVYLPFGGGPEHILPQMAAYRYLDLTEKADRIVCFRPPAHLIRHPNKILWFIHHIREFYDLWDTPYCPYPHDQKHRSLRDAIHGADTAALREARHIFTNSAIVQGRLKRYNGVDSTVLYPPIIRPERFTCEGHNDEIVYICRIEDHKRQHLLIHAMAYTQTPVRLRICGTASDPGYRIQLANLIRAHDLQEKVTFEDRWISEEEKAGILARCLAAAYLPLDEDSYGYPSLEAGHAAKAVLTTSDSGGVLELIQDGVNGYVAEADPRALGQAMDAFYADRDKTVRMGVRAREQIGALRISWPDVIRSLTQ